MVCLDATATLTCESASDFLLCFPRKLASDFLKSAFHSPTHPLPHAHNRLIGKPVDSTGQFHSLGLRTAVCVNLGNGAGYKKPGLFSRGPNASRAMVVEGPRGNGDILHLEFDTEGAAKTAEVAMRVMAPQVIFTPRE